MRGPVHAFFRYRRVPFKGLTSCIPGAYSYRVYYCGVQYVNTMVPLRCIRSTYCVGSYRAQRRQSDKPLKVPKGAMVVCTARRELISRNITYHGIRVSGCWESAFGRGVISYQVRINLDQRTSVLPWTNGSTYELRVHAGGVQMLVPIYIFSRSGVRSVTPEFISTGEVLQSSGGFPHREQYK